MLTARILGTSETHTFDSYQDATDWLKTRPDADRIAWTVS